MPLRLSALLLALSRLLKKPVKLQTQWLLTLKQLLKKLPLKLAMPWKLLVTLLAKQLTLLATLLKQLPTLLRKLLSNLGASLEVSEGGAARRRPFLLCSVDFGADYPPVFCWAEVQFC